jgi:16S rRNA (cytidine1402-2'-O)-methyltransferase
MHNPKPTTLYVVATPIGHLKDMTVRAIETLQSVAFIWCEDTRVTKVLLDHYNITTPLVSYHDHTTKDQMISKLAQAQGQTIALVSDAGTPLMQDPGYELVQYAIEQEIKIESIPGPSSIMNALVVSGVAPYPFTFAGFIPSKAAQRRRFLQTYILLDHTLVFFETAKRIQSTLEELKSLNISRDVVIAREMTKQFETIYRGSIDEIINQSIIEKGEIVLVLGPQKEQAQDPLQMIQTLVDQGMKPVEAIRTVAKWTDTPKHELYEQYENRSK